MSREANELHHGFALERAQLFHLAKQIAGLAALDGGHLNLDVHERFLDPQLGQRRGNDERTGLGVGLAEDNDLPSANRRAAVRGERVVDFAVALRQRDRAGGTDAGRLPRKAQRDRVVEAFVTDGPDFQVHAAALQNRGGRRVDLDAERRRLGDGDGEPFNVCPVKNPVARAANHLDGVGEVASDIFFVVGVGDRHVDECRGQFRLWLGLEHDWEAVDVRWHLDGVHHDAGREIFGREFQRAAEVAARDLQHRGDAVAPGHRHHLARLRVLCAVARDECRQFRRDRVGLDPVNVVRAALAEVVGDTDKMFAVGR